MCLNSIQLNSILPCISGQALPQFSRIDRRIPPPAEPSASGSAPQPRHSKGRGTTENRTGAAAAGGEQIRYDSRRL